MEKANERNEIINERISSKQLTDPKLNIRISYRSSSLVISIILVFLSVIVRNVSVQPEWINFILQIFADATSVCATGIIIASLTWLSDISSIFQQTILSTKEAISTDIREIKDSIDYSTDLSKFPFDKLHDDQLTQLTKLTIREALERHTGSEEAISTTQTRLINELESYYTGVIDGIYRGIIYNYYSREIDIEPDDKGVLHIRFRTNLSLELSLGCTNEQFFHKPVSATREYANSLQYQSIQIDGKEMLHDETFRQHTESIQEIGTDAIKYQRGWEYPLSPGTIHTLNMEHTILCHEQVYSHSAVLTYPCAHFEITCKIVGPYKDKWRIDADAFYPKGHRLDKEHRKDIIKMHISDGENEYRLVQNANTPCLLDGSAYKFVVFQTSASANNRF